MQKGRNASQIGVEARSNPQSLFDCRVAPMILKFGERPFKNSPRQGGANLLLRHSCYSKMASQQFSLNEINNGRMLRIIGHGVLFCLVYQFNKADYFWLWFCFNKSAKGILIQAAFQIADHIKIFPPAIKCLPAGQTVISTGPAVLKGYRAAQSGASTFTVIVASVHL